MISSGHAVDTPQQLARKVLWCSLVSRAPRHAVMHAEALALCVNMKAHTCEYFTIAPTLVYTVYNKEPGLGLRLGLGFSLAP